MRTVDEWFARVRWMEHELRTREVWWFFILDFTPDEVAAAHEFLERRLGYSVEIRTPT